MTFYTVQFLRFVAATLVLLFHLDLVHSGYKGVDIFFVISGFVMYYTLFAKKRPRAIHFVVNRATKIYFFYWVALAFLFVVTPEKLASLNLKTILLVPGHLQLLGVSWSLSFEIYFYCIVGGCAYLMPGKYRVGVFLSLFIITSVITIIDLYTPRLQHTTINYVLGPNFWEFLLGIWSAHLALRYHTRISKRQAVVFAVLCLAAFCIIAVTHMDPLAYLVYGPLSFFIVTLFVAYEDGKKINKTASGIFKVLGDASYGIYLLGPVITIAIFPGDITAKIKIIILTIGVSILFNQFIENKILSRIRKELYNKFPKH